ncbi:MAG: hypothetical protein GX893_04570 [Firmicutes bacterium]|nr:hypothetical protein [Bacillota bacterium]
MWIKWLGAALIITASMIWGNFQAEKLRERTRQLEEFRLALRLLAAEIGYTATPLPRALSLVAERLTLREVQNFFSLIGQELQQSTGIDAATAWLKAAQTARHYLYLTPRDWTVLSRAAAGLGTLGREDQLKQLAAAEAQLASHAADAAEKCASGEKMWRYLGALCGMAVVILLL